MVDWQLLIEREAAPPAVNVWSLKKDQRIKFLLLKLIEQIGQSNWFVDHNIRISREAAYLIHKQERDLRAYLHIHGQSRDRAGLHLEYPRQDGMAPTYEAYENLTLPQLVDMLAAHFGISRVLPATDRAGN